MSLRERKQPLVSIITSCFNHESYIDEYMEGMLSQTYNKVQLILFDDGSKDESWHKISGWLPRLNAKFSEVICERHENMGLVGELALAIKLIKGQIVCCIATDDQFLPNAISDVVEYMDKNQDVSVVYGDADLVYSDKVLKNQVSAYYSRYGLAIPEGDVYERMFDRFMLYIVACGIRTAALMEYVNFEEYGERNYHINDIPMLLDLAKNTKFGFLNKTMTRYRILDESMCHSQDRGKLFNVFKRVQKIKMDYLNRSEVKDEIRERFIKNYHRHSYYESFDLYRPDEFYQSYEWLSKRYKEEYRRYWHRIRAFSMKNKVIWRIVKKGMDLGIMSKLKAFAKKGVGA